MSGLQLPGFRFHPTEQELLGFYLKNLVFGNKMHLDIIGFLNIYLHDPWDLPGLAKIGEREWYFFVPRNRKQSNGGRPNRTTKKGFWKATGSDRKVVSLSEPKRVIGLRKTLVFYKGKAPKGSKTDWVMNEFRLPDTHPLPPKDIVLCKIYRKATSLKVMEERAAREEEAEKSKFASFFSCPTSPISSSSNWTTSFLSGGSDDQLQNLITSNLISTNYVINDNHTMASNVVKDDRAHQEEKFDLAFKHNYNYNNNSVQLPLGKESLAQLQVPKFTMDWAQDPLWTPSFSPWIANLLNFNSPTLLSPFLST